MIQEKLVTNDNVFIASAEELKEAPVILYGAGILAERLCMYLKERQIEVTAFVVDDAYVKPGQYLLEKPVYGIQKYFECLEEPCNLVVAFTECEREAVTPYQDKIKRLFMYDFCGMFTLGPLNVMTQEFIREHEEDIAWLEENLADDTSKEVIAGYINQKITGEYRVKCDENQYFAPDIINLQDGEVFVDCGAFTGDSIESFLRNLKLAGKEYRALYAFEPDPENVARLRDNLRETHDLHVIAGGAWDVQGVLTFDTEANTGSKISQDGNITVPVYTVDDVTEGNAVTFIKMDIEGSEMNALRGAEKTIRKNRPKLAICTYHKNTDIFEIPRYIKNLIPEYQLYYRRYAETATELVLYAVLK